MSDQEEELVWEAPPEPWLRSKYRPHVAAVKKRPGAWLKVRDKVPQGVAYSASTGMKKLFDSDPRFEVSVNRLDDDNNYSVYLRYRNDEQMGNPRPRTR